MDSKETAVSEESISRHTVQKPSDVAIAPQPPFLFEHVTTLASGLITAGLLSLTGYTLLDYWLGDNTATNYLSGYMYSLYLYLFCGLLFFTALHLWAYWRRERRSSTSDNTLPVNRTAHTFLVIFLVILKIAVVSNIVAASYIAANAALGTADYSTKGLWNALLGPLQAGIWAALFCWYFKGTSKGRSAKLYVIITGMISLVIAGLLLAFPIIAKRNAVIDDRTSEDLSSISVAINDFVDDNSKLPDTLTGLKLDDKIKARLSGYEYQKTANTSASSVQSVISEDDSNGTLNDLFRSSGEQFSYKLCADFKTDTSKNNDRSPIPFLATSSDFSTHPAGRHCFDKTAYGKGIIDDQPVSSDSSGSSLKRY